jgi:hypothetical protein
MVPRRSTWTWTPISNMSAAGAIITSAMSACASSARASSDTPDSAASWFTDPVSTYAAPSANAPATACGLPRPPAAPTLIRRWYPCRAATASRSARIAGSIAHSGWLSVWPPLSASTVTSSATGTRAASLASSWVSWPLATSAASRPAGAGDMNFSATSGLDTFAKIRTGRTI